MASSTDNGNHYKVQENRLRRMAERQGLELRKSRRRDPRSIDYGNFWLVNPTTNMVEVGGENGMDIDEAEAALKDGRS